MNPKAFTCFMISSFILGVSFTTSIFNFLLDPNYVIIFKRHQIKNILNENNITIS